MEQAKKKDPVRLSARIKEEAQRLGFALVGISPVGRAFVDSGPVLERDIAGVAGIGWIGKNTHLISPRLGSWFFLGELFLSIELAYDRGRSGIGAASAISA